MYNSGYLTSNTNNAWPFDSDYPSLNRDLASIFADGSALLYATENNYDVIVSGIYINEESISFNVIKRDNTTKKEYSEHVSAELSNGEYTTINRSWFFFVLDNHNIKRLTSEGDFSSYDLPLDNTAVTLNAENIRSITLYNHYKIVNDRKVPTDELHEDGTIAGIKGKVQLFAGTNMYVGQDTNIGASISIDSPLSDFGGNAIVLAALPGYGLGTVPCDDKESDCENIGNLVPDDEGNLVIEADQCFQVSADERIKITGRCTACCQCDSFVDIGEKLAAHSVQTMNDWVTLMSASKIYNDYAKKFNLSLCKVSKDELLVKCVAAAQKIDAGAAHSLDLSTISGSVDRAQGVLTITNTSIEDVNVSVYASMEPQSLILGNITLPTRTDNSSVVSNTETVKCSDEITIKSVPTTEEGLVGKVIGLNILDGSNDTVLYAAGTKITQEILDDLIAKGYNTIDIRAESQFSYETLLPAGSVITIRLYGASTAKKPSSKCKISGYVMFTWTECANLENNEPGNTKVFIRDFEATQNM